MLATSSLLSSPELQCTRKLSPHFRSSLCCCCCCCGQGGFPKLKKGLTDFLKCACTVPEMAAACKQWNALELETAMQGAGLAATMCRTPAEWRASEQGQVISALPPIVIEPRTYLSGADVLAAGGPRSLPAKAARPLSDVIVIDFSHVIASPVVGRTLADHGATVIKVVSHERPRREMFDCETNHGKRVLAVELSTPEGKQRLWDLLKVADVVIDGFAGAALARRGFAKDEVLSKCPHLVYVRLLVSILWVCSHPCCRGALTQRSVDRDRSAQGPA